MTETNVPPFPSSKLVVIGIVIGFSSPKLVLIALLSHQGSEYGDTCVHQVVLVLLTALVLLSAWRVYLGSCVCVLQTSISQPAGAPQWHLNLLAWLKKSQLCWKWFLPGPGRVRLCPSELRVGAVKVGGKVDLKNQTDLPEVGEAEYNLAEFTTDNNSFWK